MAIERYFSSTAVATTLSGNINSSATSITVGAVTGFPPTFPYTLAIDYGGSAEELVDVTAAASTTLTVTRAVDGTSATSHSSGAAVRHVASARDFTAYQNHQNATSGVHGVSGTVVGTSDTQTLSAKTLTSPTINGATTTGTFATGTTTITGTPTFSGGPIFSGTQSFTGAATFDGTASVMFYRTAGTSISLQTRLTADTGPRWLTQANGVHIWGDGTGNNDTNLYRLAANSLATDDALTVGGALAVTGNSTLTGNLTVSGIGQELFAYKTADTSRASTAALADDPHLTVTVTANATYMLQMSLFATGGTTGDFQGGWNMPSGTAGKWSLNGPSLAVGAAALQGEVRYGSDTLATARTAGMSATTQGVSMPAVGLVRVGGTGGAFTFQWSQAVSDATATVLQQDSWMRLKRIA